MQDNSPNTRLQVAKSKIGDAEIFQIVEVRIGYQLIGLLPEATPDFLQAIEWMAPPDVFDDYSLRASSQCFIIRINDRILVVDTCVGMTKL
ncbi:MAG: hypothetical protein R3B74_08745 [Nitrospirales bacterium]|nr:hypothetical protein [Nitrospirales bacterium]